ncbi:MAG: energy-coupling factor ABC transporter ATP-binding protein [Candidatus Hodarchaeota archaeon]
MTKMFKIDVEDLTFRYEVAETPALRNVNLKVKEGEFILITGPTDAGKSTFCKAISGIVPHIYPGEISGQVLVDGINTLETTPSDLSEKVGVVMEDPESQITATHVFAEVAFGPENLALPQEEILKLVDESLNLTALEGFEERLVHTLSGGEKQKLVMASCFAMQPDIFVLDEPTEQLDAFGAELVFSVVKSLSKRLGKTVVIASHRLDYLVPLADRIVIMNQGEIVLDDPPRKVFSESFDLLKHLGINLPQVVTLYYELRRAGVSIQEVPLDFAEAYQMISKELGIK